MKRRNFLGSLLSAVTGLFGVASAKAPPGGETNEALRQYVLYPSATSNNVRSTVNANPYIAWYTTTTS